MKPELARRHKARRYAVQGIYHWQMTQATSAEVLDYMLAEVNENKTDMEYFAELVQQVSDRVTEIDTQLQPHLDREVERVDPVERAILRIAMYEMLEHQEIPYRVIINEAIEQAKTFGAEEGHKYINGVLDKAATIVRTLEFNSHTKKQN